MKILLVAVNAKYIHSSLAVNSIAQYSKQRGIEISVSEYTINNTKEYIVESIYKQNPDVVAFSCYIWNYSYVKDIAETLGKVMPKVPIWFGGPECSFDAKEVLANQKAVFGVMRGEGEETFYELAAWYQNDSNPELGKIEGITYRSGQEIIETPNRAPMNLDELPFCYEELEKYKNKIIYYEGSRGCPFSCSYCLSSVDKKVRFKSIDKIKSELNYFIENDIPQVKFVDRTFNCNHRYTKEIWKFLIEKDKGITNFHFEISADLLDEEELELVSRMREGLIQMETGIQSTNPDTIKAIDRTMDFNQVKEKVQKIKSFGNVHQHLDLIAGLPFEGYERFKQSYDDVYELRPNQLQLGFLKVLKGSKMYRCQEEYGLKYLSNPPYEVLETKYLTYNEMLKIKLVEEMTEVYYNSGQFEKTLCLLESKYQSPFEMFLELGEFYENNGYRGINHSRIARYEILREFIAYKNFGEKNIFDEAMIYDLYERENLKSRPKWAKEHRDYSSFYRNEKNVKKYLGDYENYEYKQIIRMTHMEHFSVDFTKWKETPVLDNLEADILFDYRNRSKLDNSARVVPIPREDL